MNRQNCWTLRQANANDTQTLHNIHKYAVGWQDGPPLEQSRPWARTAPQFADGTVAGVEAGVAFEAVPTRPVRALLDHFTRDTREPRVLNRAVTIASLLSI